MKARLKLIHGLRNNNLSPVEEDLAKSIPVIAKNATVESPKESTGKSKQRRSIING